MQVTIELPDDIAACFVNEGEVDAERAVLERLPLQGYRSGELSHAQIGRMLGIESRSGIDTFLKAHGVDDDYTEADLANDLATARSLGLLLAKSRCLT